MVSELDLRPRCQITLKNGGSVSFENGPSHLWRVDLETMHEYWIASPILESKMADIGDKQDVLAVRM